MSTPPAIVPAHRAIALQFLPTLNGDERSFLTNPALNNLDDWIPEYPPQPEEQADELADNQDNEAYPAHPEDEQRDYLDDNEQDAEAEALGDLYNSQFED